METVEDDCAWLKTKAAYVGFMFAQTECVKRSRRWPTDENMTICRTLENNFYDKLSKCRAESRAESATSASVKGLTGI